MAKFKIKYPGNGHECENLSASKVSLEFYLVYKVLFEISTTHTEKVRKRKF